METFRDADACALAETPRHHVSVWGREARRRLTLCLAAWTLLLAGMQALSAHDTLAEPLEEIEAFGAGGVVGNLILPAGAPDRRTPAIVLLRDADLPDGRAGLCMDQLLAAGHAVLEVVHLPEGGLATVFVALARHPRLAGQHLGLLAFGPDAGRAAQWSGLLGPRALLHPGCAALAPAASGWAHASLPPDDSRLGFVAANLPHRRP